MGTDALHSALGLDPHILQAIQEAGYTEPTPIQSAAIPVVIEGGDVIGIAQTGTGKTAAFTLPILTPSDGASDCLQGQRRRTRVLVLAPTRELVAQIEENVLAYARHLPLKIAKVYRRRRRKAAEGRPACRQRHRHRLPGPPARPHGPGLRGFLPARIPRAR
jgi:superfamily II DNA/RNA helicase